MSENKVELYIDPALALPNNDQWENRFEIKSETSDRIYVIAQHKKKRHWACSCPAWRTRRYCNHLRTIGLPTMEEPYEPQITRG